MADRAKKISQLPVLGNASGVDLLPIVDNHTTSAANTKSITVAAFLANVASNTTLSDAAVLSANTFVVRKNNTPANSSVTVTRGTIWADTDYLYVAVANNVVKRVALNTF